MRARLAFVLISENLPTDEPGYGIATDSARVSRSARWAGGWPSRATGCLQLPRRHTSNCQRHGAHQPLGAGKFANQEQAQ